jgi:hypothetical protein
MQSTILRAKATRAVFDSKRIPGPTTGRERIDALPARSYANKRYSGTAERATRTRRFGSLVKGNPHSAWRTPS